MLRLESFFVVLPQLSPQWLGVFILECVGVSVGGCRGIQAGMFIRYGSGRGGGDP